VLVTTPDRRAPCSGVETRGHEIDRRSRGAETRVETVSKLPEGPYWGPS
jgi:hypothetical protein